MQQTVMQLLRIGSELSNIVYSTKRLEYRLPISLERFTRILTIELRHLSLRSPHWPIKCLNLRREYVLRMKRNAKKSGLDVRKVNLVKLNQLLKKLVKYLQVLRLVNV